MLKSDTTRRFFLGDGDVEDAGDGAGFVAIADADIGDTGLAFRVGVPTLPETDLRQR